MQNICVCVCVYGTCCQITAFIDTVELELGKIARKGIIPVDFLISSGEPHPFEPISYNLLENRKLLSDLMTVVIEKSPNCLQIWVFAIIINLAHPASFRLT